MFDRKARPICTTEAGELFRGHALTALLELQRGVDAARSTLDNFVAHVTIGSYPSVSSTYLPVGAAGAAGQSTPASRSTCAKGPPRRWRRWSRTGTVDLAFRPLLPKMRETTLCHRTIWREDIVAVMRENDPLAEQASVSVDDMLSRPLIGNPAGTEEDGGGFDVRNTLGEAAARANIAYLTDQPATLVALVRCRLRRRRHQPPRAADHQHRGTDHPDDRLADRAPERRACSGCAGARSSAVVKAFLDAQQRAPLPPGVRPIADRSPVT